MAEMSVLIVRLTDSFSDFWPILARELEVSLVEWRPADGEPPAAGAAIVLVAAGGGWLDLPSFFHQLGIPSHLPIAPVGPPPGHPRAARPCPAGPAAGYALPEDCEAPPELPPPALTR